ncbi:unnamed protein product, partial [Vitrella brassicaformis CCMP3155]
MSSGRPDTDMAPAGPADGGDGDEDDLERAGQHGGGDVRRPVDLEERQEGRAGGGAVSNVVVRQRNNASMTEPSRIPSPAIYLEAGAVDGPQAAASPSSYTGVGVGVVKRAGFPLEREEPKRARGEGQAHPLAANLPNAQQPQRPPAPHPAAGVGVLPSTGLTLSGHAHRPPPLSRLGGGVSSAGGDRAVGAGVGGDGSDGQQGSGQGRQTGGAPLPSGWNSLESGEIDVRFPLGTSYASRQLSESIIRRTITDAQQVTQLIQQKGADLNVEPLLRVAGTTGRYEAYPLVALCIDNLTDNRLPSIWAGDGGDYSPVAMPTWETPALQLAVMRALIQRGADINGGSHLSRPIRVALASCNRAAFDLLMGQPGIQLRGREAAMQVRTLPTDQPTEAHEAILLSFYRQLIQRDTTLATERDLGGMNLLHSAAMRPPVWSQQFIESYIDLLVANGADITAVDILGGRTPLHLAALCSCGSHRVAASLCRRLTAADINRGTPNDPTYTPLTVAAERLDEDIQQLQEGNTGQAVRDRLTFRIPHVKTTIRVLLQAGADIALMPTATEEDRRRRQLVLPEYATVLNNLPDDVMAAVLNNLPDDVMAAINGQAIHLKAGAVNGPQAAASPSSY